MVRIITITVILISYLSQLLAQYATEIVVAKDGSGDFISIQKALDNTKSFPDKPITIFIKKGVYNEKVRIYPWNTNLTIVGESKDSTIITYQDFFSKIDKGRNSTFHTYTLSIEANDVTIKNVKIVNSSGSVGQAISLSVSGNRVKVENCNILGYQDTLYCTGENHKQYFLHCYIAGTTDFIFGNAVAVFEDCQIHSLSDSYITAASTTKEQRFGLVFYQCKLTSDPEVSRAFLGRPWRPFAKTAFINCEYGSHILDKGWSLWNNEENVKADYVEYHSNRTFNNRVSWARNLSKKQAEHYKPENILKNWNYK